jgi:hypothetical protein
LATFDTAWKSSASADGHPQRSRIRFSTVDLPLPANAHEHDGHRRSGATGTLLDDRSSHADKSLTSTGVMSTPVIELRKHPFGVAVHYADTILFIGTRLKRSPRRRRPSGDGVRIAEHARAITWPPRPGRTKTLMLIERPVVTTRCV